MADINKQETLGTRIKRLREEKNLTQEQLAQKVGCTNTTIYNWEKREGISTNTFQSIAEALGVNAYYLATGNESNDKISYSDEDMLVAVNTVADVYETQSKMSNRNSIFNLIIMAVLFNLIIMVVGFTGLYKTFNQNPEVSYSMLICFTTSITVFFISYYLENRIISIVMNVMAFLFLCSAFVLGFSLFL